MVWRGLDRVGAAMVDIKLITFRMVNKDVNWKWLNHCAVIIWIINQSDRSPTLWLLNHHFLCDIVKWLLLLWDIARTESFLLSA